MDRAANRGSRAGRRRRRLGAWLGMAALAPHLLVALAQVAVAADTAPLVCVVYGGGAEPRDTDKRQKKSRPDCPVCQTETLCKNLLPASAGAAPLPPVAGVVRLAAPSTTLIENRAPFRQSARGPPHT